MEELENRIKELEEELHDLQVKYDVVIAAYDSLRNII